MYKPVLVILLSITCFSQVKSQNCINIKNKSYQGRILDVDSSILSYVYEIMDCDSFYPFYPDSATIHRFEDGLKTKVKKKNAHRECQNAIKGCPVIHRSLSRYFRKYIGIKNKQTGETQLIVSFKLKKYTSSEELCKNYRFSGFDDSCSEAFILVYSVEHNYVTKIIIDCE